MQQMFRPLADQTFIQMSCVMNVRSSLINVNAIWLTAGANSVVSA